ncbi:MAG TPA: BCAM0308 family protein [Casimicrobiaceae bacterium]|nr:BCAM0308 family protein [Casimicrobiaceae bacterium]
MNRKSTPSPATPPGRLERHGARILDDARHDPYQAQGKLAEPTRCGTCGAVYHRGRWQWIEATQGTRSSDCPACRRVHDGLPAGWLTIEGSYVGPRRADLVALARHQAEQERSEHPLHRIMNVAEDADRIEITTTDIHLPRRIGEALKRAHDGELRIDYGKDSYEVRVHWQR